MQKVNWIFEHSKALMTKSLKTGMYFAIIANTTFTYISWRFRPANTLLN